MTTSPGLYCLLPWHRSSVQLLHYPKGGRRKPDYGRSQFLERWKWEVAKPILAHAGLISLDDTPLQISEEVGSGLVPLFLALHPPHTKSAATVRAVRRATTAFTLLTAEERARLHEVLYRPEGVTMLRTAFGMLEPEAVSLRAAA